MYYHSGDSDAHHFVIERFYAAEKYVGTHLLRPLCPMNIYTGKVNRIAINCALLANLDRSAELRQHRFRYRAR